MQEINNEKCGIYKEEIEKEGLRSRRGIRITTPGKEHITLAGCKYLSKSNHCRALDENCPYNGLFVEDGEVCRPFINQRVMDSYMETVSNLPQFNIGVP